MRIKKINSQHRRYFWADYECEHCGFIDKDKSGYNNLFFHQNVIPKMKCKQCGKIASNDYKSFAPKYAKGQQV